MLLLAYIAFLSEMFENCILLRVLDAEFDAATAPGTWLLPVLPLMARTKFASLFIACLLLGAAYARYFRPMTPPEDLLDLDASAVTGGKPGTRLVRTRRRLLGSMCDMIMLAGRADAVLPSLCVLPLVSRCASCGGACALLATWCRYFLAGGIGVVAVFGAPACNFLLEPAALLLGLAWNATWIHGLHLAFVFTVFRQPTPRRKHSPTVDRVRVRGLTTGIVCWRWSRRRWSRMRRCAEA